MNSIYFYGIEVFNSKYNILDLSTWSYNKLKNFEIWL
jgi:hypothetical protein